MYIFAMLCCFLSSLETWQDNDCMTVQEAHLTIHDEHNNLQYNTSAIFEIDRITCGYSILNL